MNVDITLNRAEVYALQAATAKVAEAQKVLVAAQELQIEMANDVMQAQGFEPKDYRATNLDSATRKLTVVSLAPYPPRLEAYTPTLEECDAQAHE